MLYGSICLSDIPKDQIKKVATRKGDKMYLNIAIIERKTESQYGHTHFISCSPKEEDRVEGVNYIIGDLKTYVSKSAPAVEMKNNASVVDTSDLPF